MINRRNFIKGTVAGILAAGAFDVAGLFPEQKVIAAENLSVKTRYGTFNGFTDTKGVKTWLGIPYAKPPQIKLLTQKNLVTLKCKLLTKMKAHRQVRKVKIV